MPALHKLPVPWFDFFSAHRLAAGCALLLLFAHALFGQSLPDQWEPANEGLNGATATAFGFADDGSVLAGTTTGMLLLSPGGTEWRQTSITWHVYDVDKAPSGALLAGTARGVYRSTDNGVSWELLVWLPGLTHFHFAPNNTLYAVRGNFSPGYLTYYSSTDEGITWQTRTLQDYYNHSGRLIHTANGALLLANYKDLLRSQDNGSTWTKATLTQPVISCVVLRPSGDLLAGTGTGVWRSTDNGLSWRNVDSLPVTDIQFTKGGEYLYRNDAAGTIVNGNCGIHRSIGGDPARHTQVLKSSTITAMEVAPDGTVWAGADASILRSTDDGLTWERFDQSLVNRHVANVIGTPWGDFYALALSGTEPIDVNLIYSLYRSTDQGKNWSFVRDNFSTELLTADNYGNLFVGRLETDWWPSGPNSFYSEEYTQVYQSIDKGTSWQLRGEGDIFTGLSVNGNGTIAFSAFNITGFGTEGGNLIFSNDEGKTWSRLTEPQKVWSANGGKEVRSVVVLPDGEMVAGIVRADDTGLKGMERYRINREGTAAVDLSDSLVFFSMALAPDGAILASGSIGFIDAFGREEYGIYRSTDKGASWTKVADLLNDFDVHFSVRNDGLIFATQGYPYETTLRSTDNGITWEELTAAGRPLIITWLVFHPNGSVFGILDRQVVRSVDRGETWQLFSNGLPDTAALSLSLSPDGTFVCGTNGHGAYRLDLLSGIEEGSKAGSERRMRLTEGAAGTRRLFFRLDAPGSVSIDLYDLLGRKVARLFKGDLEAGEESLPLMLSQLPAGTYLLTLNGPDGFFSEKVQLR